MKPFDINRYEVIYTQCEVSILRRAFIVGGNYMGMSLDMPMYAMTFRGELMQHLYDNKRLDTGPAQLAGLIAHAYKEMFYYHFARGEVWKGRALENALLLMYHSVTADKLYDKCAATHWAIRHSRLPISAQLFGDCCHSNDGWSDISGNIRIYGDTPTNGKQFETRAFMEVNVGTKPVWTHRGMSSGRVMTQKLSLSTPYLYGTELPNWDAFFMQHFEQIKEFLDRENKK